MPADWRRNLQYVFQYSHPQGKIEGIITLKCVPMQNLLLIHGSMKDTSEVLSLKIPVTNFVRIDRPLDSGIYYSLLLLFFAKSRLIFILFLFVICFFFRSGPGLFQKLDQFSRLFKDSISYRLINQIYEAGGMYNKASLSGLVPEIKVSL